MNVLSWNCRGLGNQRTFQFLKELVTQKKPNFIFLCETKCNKKRTEWVGQQLGFEGSFCVEAQGVGGGLVLYWKEKEEGVLLGFSNNHIDIRIDKVGYPSWRLTGFYGEPNRNRRERTWNLLRTIAGSSSLPWCVIGDVNNILNQEDKKGGQPYPGWLLEGFQKALTDCHLFDLDLTGYPFTWEKSRGTTLWVEIRLDRAMVTEAWTLLFQGAKLFNLETSTSDHSPLFLEPIFVEQSPTNYRFRFENAWLKEPMCFQIVEDCWQRVGVGGILNKLNVCADALSQWGKEITGNFKRRIRECNAEMKLLKKKRDDISMARYSEVRKQLFAIIDQREIFWKQRAKQFWLKEGDQNSKYFHKAASNRRRSNLISKLKNDQGVFVDWENGLSDVVVQYFMSLFSASNTDYREVIDCIDHVVPEMANLELTRPVLEEEVKTAVFQMHPDKSPGPDGMTPTFYQRCWHIVKQDVVGVVQRFFATGAFDEACSDANVVLIPKKKGPETMKDLRPIALCNVLYKIVTKVMTNRMKPFMDSIVADSQSAFIPNRLISDNIMVSFEVLHYLKRKRQGKTGCMALKLDMSKAYDRIEWSFLEAVLTKLGFVDTWVHLIMQCVSSANYKVIHGSHEMGPIAPTRGLRQGDPLSPYLFILCAEGLSALLRKYERQGWIHGCKVANGAPRVSHMLFADDSYLYCQASEVEAHRVRKLLTKFERASGQEVNLSKSSIFFSTNTTTTVRNVISQRLQMSIATEDSFYLGLPSTMSRKKTVVLGYLKDKVRKRLQQWEGKFLSRAGKEVLVKTVAQALPSYAMSVFLLPKEISRSIESMMASYWWQTNKDSGKGIHWLSWDKLCKHKKGGGLGFRNLRDFNLAMLGKQGWRLLTRPDSLVTRVFKARYFPQGDFLSASIGSNPSFVWRSIWESQDLVRKGVRWCIGSGNNIPILQSPWLPDEVNPFVISDHPALSTATVSNILTPDGSRWDVEILDDLFVDRDKHLIMSIPLSDNNLEDHFVWSKETSGFYSVKSAYNLLQRLKGGWHESNDNNFWSKLWSLKLPPKIKNLMWRAAVGCLPTMIQLRTKHVEVSSLCPLWRVETETIIHCLVTCNVIKLCWNRVGIGTTSDTSISFLDWCTLVFSKLNAEKKALVAAVCWAIWNARNELVWKGKTTRVDDIVGFAKHYLNQWNNAQNSVLGTSYSDDQIYDGAEHWSPPLANSIKVNVDAALFDDGRSFGSGMVARDDRGWLIEGRTILAMNMVEPLLAEAISVKEALTWIKLKQWHHVTVESDCLGVVQALRSSICMISLFGQVIQSCKNLLADLSTVEVIFVKRSANSVAHSFARASKLYPDRTFSMESVPTDLLPCLVTEFVG
ncbi:uncharacterized protein LOC133034618 [Cannabis sativa]|uniref:uncharacterized protein LOC133034618 n=1 Tax=Cannabis sativa TaxID=3483 RepID=UPI0029CAA805|nr:uncharacterized protein LOC133034618 [Cannabis sativa]